MNACLQGKLFGKVTVMPCCSSSISSGPAVQIGCEYLTRVEKFVCHRKFVLHDNEIFCMIQSYTGKGVQTVIRPGEIFCMIQSAEE